MEFEVTLAEDYCMKVADGTHDSPKNTESGYKLITSRHLQEFNLDFVNANFISKEDYEEINKRSRVDQFDILFSMIGTVGRIYLEKRSDIDYAIKNVGLFKNKSELEAKWLYYYLHSPLAHEYIHQNLRGSTQQYIPLGSLRKFPIKHPKSKKDMRKIVNMLDSIDKKRESNILIISHLEDIAQTLFKRWFVDFEFPNENGEPYKSSGGEMVESEFGLIPKFFDVEYLSESVSFLSGGTPKTKVEEFWGGDIPFFTPKDITGAVYVSNTEKRITELGLSNCNSKLYPKDTLFLTARGTVGKINLANTEMAMNQSCFAMLHKDNNQYFLFFLVGTLLRKIIQGSNGAVFNAINLRDLNSLKIISPTAELAYKFNNLVEPIFKRLSEMEQENITLKSLRDTLLPKLLSGEIELPDETEVTENVPVS